jgi:hypothetical protein
MKNYVHYNSSPKKSQIATEQDYMRISSNNDLYMNEEDINNRIEEDLYDDISMKTINTNSIDEDEDDDSVEIDKR